MQTLITGQFFGQTNETVDASGITLTDTEYTHARVDWHYHENAYFTLLLEGRMIEGNKKETYHCPAGTLLFHNWQEAHFNTKPEGFTRGFHIEIGTAWIREYGLNLNQCEGSMQVTDPVVRSAAYHILKESKLKDANSQLAIHSTLINLVSRLCKRESKEERTRPAWTVSVRELLHDLPSQNWTLTSLATQLNIHPVHLSRDFSRHFGCTLSTYIRICKVQRALSLFTDRQRSLTDIAYDCGFSDQSHFIRCFREVHQLQPARFRKLLVK